MLQYRKHSVVSIKCLSAECENMALKFEFLTGKTFL